VRYGARLRITAADKMPTHCGVQFEGQAAFLADIVDRRCTLSAFLV
jgi:hypothetical protein